ncbi:MAG: hypothetical protein Q4A56_02425 [Porphyromonadaceae bacterium]|nr:hypothetical protein [Porphyromonadaceae bacterium]
MKKEILKIKKSEMAAIKGGTTTTLEIVVSCVENEYRDCNGNKDLDEGDEYIGQRDSPCDCDKLTSASSSKRP